MKRFIGLFILFLCVLILVSSSVMAESTLKPTTIIKSVETVQPPTFNTGETFEIIYVHTVEDKSTAERVVGEVKGLVERGDCTYLLLLHDEDVYVIEQNDILITNKVEKEEKTPGAKAECFINSLEG